MIDVPAEPAAGPFAYCLQCARPSVDRGLALDGVHRNVFCRWYDRPGKPHGHGLTLGTFDQDEALTLVERRRRARAKAAHGRHRSASGIDRNCELCLARGAHLDHIEDRRLVAGCLECDRAQVRAWSSHVGA
jgi:hypothetical protein